MRLKEYFRDVLKELRSVKFPGKQEVKLTAVVICVVLVIVVIFVGCADFIISRLIKTLLGIL
jgi:preprotein translocase SecE subunit